MVRFPALAVHSAVLALCVSLHAPAQAQFMGIFQGVTSVVTQVAGKATSRVLAGNGQDLQEAYDKYFSQIDAHTQGMDENSKRQHRTLIEQQWPAAEHALLMSNAQLQAKKDGPLISLGDVAKATVSGIATQVGMNAAMGGGQSVLNSALQNGAMSGILDSAQNAAMEALPGNNALQSNPALTSLEFKASAAIHPLMFLDVHASTLNARDLYRAHGFIGWKRIEKSPVAQAYAHVAGQSEVQYAVFTHDENTGEVTSAFRVFKVSPAAFGSAVQEYAQLMGAAPRYASQGTVLRAVWENGAFVTSDGQKISAGWSQSVPQLYASAP